MPLRGRGSGNYRTPCITATCTLQTESRRSRTVSSLSVSCVATYLTIRLYVLLTLTVFILIVALRIRNIRTVKRYSFTDTFQCLAAVMYTVDGANSIIAVLQAEQ